MNAIVEHSQTKKRVAADNGRESVVTIRDLEKSFGDRDILKKVNLDLFKGENLVIIGKSGTGKSVLIKCMVGLIKPDAGHINILGYDVPYLNEAELNELRLQVGFSFQGSALYDSMTVRENLEFPLKRNMKLFDRNKLNDLIIEALEDVGLAHAVDQFPSELSGGMKKRIGIARTLILKPKIMLYDEPTAGLDPITSREINELINSVREKYHTSSIIITHDLTCAKQTGDRLVALFNGQIQVEGSFKEMSQVDDPEIKAFFNY
ncbi:ABC transporter ATP-binding protein [Pseudochryseolinea flava]|uniref:ABC transporter ATP-binding protein n=1 Tax=Pseudochryseolinea flava TaxID=2059302 RepID=A0A364Y4U2_9BACT|nr:ATP-binding cassette domain-containing protein [Pseudochryseolinea flava]RAW01769.1 ABC transporter ATP-binding protein [Pseudochryseolinea flava]